MPFKVVPLMQRVHAVQAGMHQHTDALICPNPLQVQSHILIVDHRSTQELRIYTEVGDVITVLPPCNGLSLPWCCEWILVWALWPLERYTRALRGMDKNMRSRCRKSVSSPNDACRSMGRYLWHQIFIQVRKADDWFSNFVQYPRVTKTKVPKDVPCHRGQACRRLGLHRCLEIEWLAYEFMMHSHNLIPTCPRFKVRGRR